ncbi:hypothetical protein QBC39DRAFT_328575 [Podospora conica]|nr:hypothetical protein QBC39DRAFT_328575 [Schizothecium conicum]
MKRMDNHPDNQIANRAWKFVLFRNEFLKNTDPEVDYYDERDGVTDYVVDLLDGYNYYTSSQASQGEILHFLAREMDGNIYRFLSTSIKTFRTTNPRVAYEAASWVYFHGRILEVLDLVKPSTNFFSEEKPAGLTKSSNIPAGMRSSIHCPGGSEKSKGLKNSVHYRMDHELCIMSTSRGSLVISKGTSITLSPAA